MDNKLCIFPYNLANMCKDAFIIVIGNDRRCTNHITRNIINNYNHVPCGMIISPAEKRDPFYSHFFPDSYIHHDTNSDKLKKVLARQRIMVEQRAKNKQIDASAIVVLDSMSVGAYAKDDTIMEILMNGRHYSLTTAMITPISAGITPDIRLNADYVFLTRNNSMLERKKLYNNYASMFPTFESFDKVFEECTKNDGSMVIDNRKACNNIQDKVFHFKTKHEEFVFGSQEFKNLHNVYYDINKCYTADILSPQSLGAKLVSNAKFGEADYCVREHAHVVDYVDSLFDYFINTDKVNDEFVKAFGKEFEETRFMNGSEKKLNSTLALEDFILGDNEKFKKEFDGNSLEGSIDKEFDDFMRAGKRKACNLTDETSARTPTKNKEFMFNSMSGENIFDLTSDTESTIDDGPQIKTNSGSLEMLYSDSTYRLSINLTDLSDHKLVGILLNHIIDLKRVTKQASSHNASPVTPPTTPPTTPPVMLKNKCRLRL